MASQSKLGAKVRSMRRRGQLSQVQLAEQLQISPSYLNLIEHNQRPLPAHLLVRLAQIFHVELQAFADDNQVRLDFTPEDRAHRLFTVYAQDTIAVAADTLWLTLGAKLEHNNFTGWETLPSARLAWRYAPERLLWTSVARAA